MLIFFQIRESGFDLGQTFNAITELKADAADTSYAMKVVNTKELMPSNFESEHLIHPATLDVFVHLVVSNSIDGKGRFKARVPVFLESAYVSNKFDSTPGTEYYGYCTSKNPSSGTMVTDVTALTRINDRPAVLIKGCKTVPLAGGPKSGRQVKELDEDNADYLQNWLVGDMLSKGAAKVDNILCVPSWDMDYTMTSPAVVNKELKSLIKQCPKTKVDRIESLEKAAVLVSEMCRDAQLTKEALAELLKDESSALQPLISNAEPLGAFGDLIKVQLNMSSVSKERLSMQLLLEDFRSTGLDKALR